MDINPRAVEIRERYFREFSMLTQHIYLSAFAAVRLPEVDFKELATDVSAACKSLLTPGDELWNDSIEGSKAKLKASIPKYPQFVLGSIVVRLDSFLHSLLDELHDRTDTGEEYSKSFEEDLADARDAEPTAYMWVILLAETRNAIVHHRGGLNRARFGRLLAAGWSQVEIEGIAEQLRRGITLSHVLRMKGAVRTAANVALQQRGSRREHLSLSKA